MPTTTADKSLIKTTTYPLIASISFCAPPSDISSVGVVEEDGSSVHVSQIGSIVEQQKWQLLSSLTLESELGTDLGMWPYPQATSTGEQTILTQLGEYYSYLYVVKDKLQMMFKKDYTQSFQYTLSNSFFQNMLKYKRAALARFGKQVLTTWVEMPVYSQLNEEKNNFLQSLPELFSVQDMEEYFSNHPDLGKDLDDTDFAKTLKVPLLFALRSLGLALYDIVKDASGNIITEEYTYEYEDEDGSTKTKTTTIPKLGEFLIPSQEKLSYLITYPALWAINDPRNFMKIWGYERTRQAYEAEAETGEITVETDAAIFHIGRAKHLLTLWSFMGMFIPLDAWGVTKKNTHGSRELLSEGWSDKWESEIQIPFKYFDQKTGGYFATWQAGTWGKGATLQAIDFMVAQKSAKDDLFAQAYTAMKKGVSWKEKEEDRRFYTGYPEYFESLTKTSDYKLLGIAIKHWSGWPGSSVRLKQTTAPLAAKADRDWFMIQFGLSPSSALPDKKLSTNDYTNLKSILLEYGGPVRSGGVYSQHIVSTLAPDSWKGKLNLAVHENLLDLFNVLIPYNYKQKVGIEQYNYIFFGNPAPTLPTIKSARSESDSIAADWSGYDDMLRLYNYESRYRWSVAGVKRTLAQIQRSNFYEPYGWCPDPANPNRLLRDPWDLYAAYKPVYEIFVGDPYKNPIHKDDADDEQELNFANRDASAEDQNSVYPGLTITHGHSTNYPHGSDYLAGGKAGKPETKENRIQYQDVYAYIPSGSFKNFEWIGPFNWEIFAAFYGIGVVTWISPTGDDDELYKNFKGIINSIPRMEPGEKTEDFEQRARPLRLKQEDDLREMLKDDNSAKELAKRLSVKVGVCGLKNFVHEFKNEAGMLDDMFREVKGLIEENWVNNSSPVQSQ